MPLQSSPAHSLWCMGPFWHLCCLVSTTGSVSKVCLVKLCLLTIMSTKATKCSKKRPLCLAPRASCSLPGLSSISSRSVWEQSWIVVGFSCPATSLCGKYGVLGRALGLTGWSQIHLCDLAVCPWASYLVSLSFSFLIRKMGEEISNSERCFENSVRKSMQ